MEINKFISKVLDELQDLKANNNKKKFYVVEDLEFELGVVINKEGNGQLGIKNDTLGVNLKVGGDITKENIQKVKIKLKPKN